MKLELAKSELHDEFMIHFSLLCLTLQWSRYAQPSKRGCATDSEFKYTRRKIVNEFGVLWRKDWVRATHD